MLTYFKISSIIFRNETINLIPIINTISSMRIVIARLIEVIQCSLVDLVNSNNNNNNNNDDDRQPNYLILAYAASPIIIIIIYHCIY